MDKQVNSRKQITKAVNEYGRDIIFNKYGISKLHVYGSFAYKKPKKSSDIDFLILPTGKTLNHPSGDIGINAFFKKLLNRDIDVDEFSEWALDSIEEAEEFFGYKIYEV